MIILIGNTKGGCGKSTTAWHLAYWLQKQGNETLLVDADDSASTGTNLFTAHRDSTMEGHLGYTMIRLKGKEIRRTVSELNKKYDYVIIDTGATDSSSLRVSLLIADLFIVPCQPRILDSWVTQIMFMDLVKEANANRDQDLPVIAFLSKADVRSRHNRDTQKALREQGITVLDEMIVQRKCFENATEMGLTIFEFTDLKDEALPKAQLELNKLFKELSKIMKNEPKEHAGSTDNEK